MPTAFRAGIFALFAALVIWKLARAARSGEIGSRGLTFSRESDPIWFVFGLITYVLIALFCLAEVLSAFGLAADPVTILQGHFSS